MARGEPAQSRRAEGNRNTECNDRPRTPYAFRLAGGRGRIPHHISRVPFSRWRSIVNKERRRAPATVGAQRRGICPDPTTAARPTPPPHARHVAAVLPANASPALAHTAGTPPIRARHFPTSSTAIALPVHVPPATAATSPRGNASPLRARVAPRHAPPAAPCRSLPSHRRGEAFTPTPPPPHARHVAAVLPANASPLRVCGGTLAGA